MANLWDDIAKTIREGVDTVVEKTGELTKIGRVKIDILNIKRRIEKDFTELGGKVYHFIVEDKKTQIATDEEVQEIVERIKELENKLQNKDKEIEKVKTKEQAKDKPKSKPKPASKTIAKSPSAAKSAPANSKTEAKQ